MLLRNDVLTYLLVLVGGIAIGVMLMRFAGYLERKGKPFATKEDLEEILGLLRKTTEATEAIKAQIPEDLWLRQNRWNFTRDVYVRLLESLAVAQLALRNIWDAETTQDPAPESDARRRWIADQEAKATAALEEVQRAAAVARVLLRGRALEALRQLENDVANAWSGRTTYEILDAQLTAVRVGFDVVKEAAIGDLLLEERK